MKKKHEEGDTRNRHMTTNRKDRENRRTAIFEGKAKAKKKSEGCPGGTIYANYFVRCLVLKFCQRIRLYGNL